MCFEALIDGDATEKSMRRLVREEVTSAAKDGGIAAVVVLFVLATASTPAWLVAGATVGAFVLGIALHQLVLIAGVSLLRFRSGRLVELPSVPK